MMSGMGAGLMMGLMGLIPVLVVALLAYLVLQVGQNQRTEPSAGPPTFVRPSDPNPAFAILAERYARGELTREEFLERRRDLQETAG